MIAILRRIQADLDVLRVWACADHKGRPNGMESCEGCPYYRNCRFPWKD